MGEDALHVPQPLIQVMAVEDLPSPVPPLIHRQAEPPTDLPPTASSTMSFRLLRGRALVTALLKDPNSLFFAKPVDPVRDGCPTYLDEIKEPMDLGTISAKVEGRKYQTMGQLAYDVELVFANCRQFNNPGDALTLFADALEATYWREWARLGSPRMTPEERKAMLSLLNRTLKDARSHLFRIAVDPVALGIPHYHDIIPKDKARDLSLIKRKLEKGEYTSLEDVDQDFLLMIKNARNFNGADSFVTAAANELDNFWRAQRPQVG